MRILFIPDVVSDEGTAFLRRVLPAFKRAEGVDFCVVNGENAAKGNGTTKEAYESLLSSGADAVTGGNHTLRRPEFAAVLDDPYAVALRPANLHRTAPGRGSLILERGRLRLGVVSLLGSLYMDYAENPFDAVDREIAAMKEKGVKCVLVDFHAEATSEKRAMGYYVDGRVSALIGTHTHVPTADAGVLPEGTAYMTDAGMVGVKHSVLGVSIASSTEKLRTGLPVRFLPAEGPCIGDFVLIDLDEMTGKADSIEHLRLE